MAPSALAEHSKRLIIVHDIVHSHSSEESDFSLEQVRDQFQDTARTVGGCMHLDIGRAHLDASE